MRDVRTYIGASVGEGDAVCVFDTVTAAVTLLVAVGSLDTL